mmetsp:Transcript_40581/g.95291  ORF Transcript_40581/g.95291 Transcript_40581/m.95291 type:complete len:504 (-) Transcript_40581:291-1802(-)
MKFLLAISVGLWLPRYLTAVVVDNRNVQSLTHGLEVGRGYSPQSGTLMSTCLSNKMTGMSPESYAKTYNYDYFLRSINPSDPEMLDIELENAGIMSYWLTNLLPTASQSDSDSDFGQNIEEGATQYTRYVFSIATVERFHETVNENNAELLPSIGNLLNTNQLIAFVMACGPTYIRSVRRISQVASTFMFTSTSSSTSSYSDRLLSLLGSNADGAAPSDFTDLSAEEEAERSSLTIRMRAVGLSFANINPGSMIITNLEEYFYAISDAFESMITQNAGLTRSIEVMPWLRNTSFQIATRTSFTAGTASEKQRKFNLLSNCEFISQLNGLVSSRMDTMGLLTKCLSKVMKMIYTYGPQRNAGQTSCESGCSQIPLGELNCILLGDAGASVPRRRRYLQQRMLEDHIAFLTNYFDPCLTALNSDSAIGTQDLVLMTDTWSNIPQCNKPRCLVKGAVWVESNDQSGSTCTEPTQVSHPQELLDFCVPQVTSNSATEPYNCQLVSLS